MEERKDPEWPKWAIVLRRWLLIVTGLLIAIAGLLVAVGKAGDAYDAACNVLPICPGPRWVEDTPASISLVISRDAPFKFTDLAATPPEGPKSGSQRYGNPKPTCGPIEQNAWKLHNGDVVLDSDPLFQNGWSSASYVGEPEPPDWNSFNRIAANKFGWTPNFANNRCPHGQYCKLSPDEIKAHSTSTTVSVEECGRMRMVETNFSNSHNSLTVWVRGKADHDSLWTITVPVQTYKKP